MEQKMPTLFQCGNGIYALIKTLMPPTLASKNIIAIFALASVRHHQ